MKTQGKFRVFTSDTRVKNEIVLYIKSIDLLC